MFAVKVTYCWGLDSSGHEKLTDEVIAADSFDDAKRIIGDQLFSDRVRGLKIQTGRSPETLHTVSVVSPLITFPELLEMTYDATIPRRLKQTTLF